MINYAETISEMEIEIESLKTRLSIARSTLEDVKDKIQQHGSEMFSSKTCLDEINHALHLCRD